MSYFAQTLRGKAATPFIRNTLQRFGIHRRAQPVFGEFAMHEVIEAGRKPAHTPAAPTGRDELRYRLQQQSLLGEFGRTAMQRKSVV